ncbi:MAG: SpoIIIAH-like family protein [Clostridia bacterium]
MKFSLKNLKDLKIKKSTILITAIAVLFVIAIWLNISTNSVKPEQSTANLPKMTPNATDKETIAGNNYFEAFRVNRDATRKEELKYIDAIISHDETDAETLAEAQKQKLALVENIEMEFTLESLIKAKGFKDVAVTVHKGSVNIFVASETLEDEQVAQILDIVQRETGESAKNIKVNKS